MQKKKKKKNRKCDKIIFFDKIRYSQLSVYEINSVSQFRITKL